MLNARIMNEYLKATSEMQKTIFWRPWLFWWPASPSWTPAWGLTNYVSLHLSWITMLLLLWNLKIKQSKLSFFPPDFDKKCPLPPSTRKGENISITAIFQKHPQLHLLIVVDQDVSEQRLDSSASHMTPTRFFYWSVSVKITPYA